MSLQKDNDAMARLYTESVDVNIWDLSPEQVNKLAQNMGFETSDMNELIETLAQDVEPDEVERMLQDEARMLFSREDEENVDHVGIKKVFINPKILLLITHFFTNVF